MVHVLVLTMCAPVLSKDGKTDSLVFCWWTWLYFILLPPCSYQQQRLFLQMPHWNHPAMIIRLFNHLICREHFLLCNISHRIKVRYGISEPGCEGMDLRAKAAFYKLKNLRLTTKFLNAYKLINVLL